MSESDNATSGRRPLAPGGVWRRRSCRHCGYDLRGRVSDTCSECGKSQTITGREKAGTALLYLVAIATIGVALSGVFAILTLASPDRGGGGPMIISISAHGAAIIMYVFMQLPVSLGAILLAIGGLFTGHHRKWFARAIVLLIAINLIPAVIVEARTPGFIPGSRWVRERYFTKRFEETVRIGDIDSLVDRIEVALKRVDNGEFERAWIRLGDGLMPDCSYIARGAQRSADFSWPVNGDHCLQTLREAGIDVPHGTPGLPDWEDLRGTEIYVPSDNGSKPSGWKSMTVWIAAGTPRDWAKLFAYLIENTYEAKPDDSLVIYLEGPK